MTILHKPDGKISAYIHIPFCERICYYCDFAKVLLEGQPVDAYIKALLKEIKLAGKIYPSGEVQTLYIGGGTPTALTARQLDIFLAGVRTLLPFDSRNEFTVEANPGDLTEEKLAVLKNYGVNRLSMGVQTFDDRLLKKIGRTHTSADVYRTMALLESQDFSNVSIDLIYALPGQTLESFRDTLDRAIELRLPHYSLYSLILENKTMYMNWVRQGKLELPDQDIESLMFDETMEKMEAAGRHQYEISNFAKAGKESCHNLVYWNNEHYYGFGAGASGYVGNLRYKNHAPIQHYLKAVAENELPMIHQEFLTKENQMEEEMFLGLRKKQGISKRNFEAKFGVPIEEIYGTVLPELIKEGLMQEAGDWLKLSAKGTHVGNDVFEKFLIDAEK